jgi:hypothetical protein
MRIAAVVLGGIALTVMALALVQASGSNGVTLAGGVATSTPEKKATNTPEKKATSTPEKKATSTPEKKATSTPEKKATATPVKKGNGCTPGFWKNHENAWAPTGYDPDNTLGSVFDIPGEFSSIAGDSLIEALSYGGGPTDLDAAKLLLHHAVAAVLNAAHPDIDYPFSESGIIGDVNDALDSSDRGTMLGVKGTLSAGNELGCPINGR